MGLLLAGVPPSPTPAAYPLVWTAARADGVHRLRYGWCIGVVAVSEASSNGHASVERSGGSAEPSPRKSAVRAMRQAAGMSQAELARRMGVTQGRVAQLEGQGDGLRIATLERAAEACGFTVKLVIRRNGTATDA